ncbi:hypothetical protein [Streptomyces sp. TRM64462]|uniref:hypothetical protein n=1 Tax=Streptomyces sp. TRM64462 TaxID=2741726 RepID=UPI001586116F|nr:hypothetical protein [Streptomyces sp. TRM64462]
MPQPVRVAAAARAAAKRAEKARTTEPTTPEPKTAEPKAAQPKTAQPKAADPEAADPKTPEPKSAKRRRPLARIVTPALAVLTAAALTGTALLALEYREAHRTAEARTAATAAARKAAPVILSYDHRHLDRDFKAARAHLTAPFLDEYTKTTRTVVAPTAEKYEGVVKATVAKPATGDTTPAVSVVSASPDKAVVLLFMNQVTTSTQVTVPRVDLNRVRMTLVRTDEGWKVSAVDAL